MGPRWTATVRPKANPDSTLSAAHPRFYSHFAVPARSGGAPGGTGRIALVARRPGVLDLGSARGPSAAACRASEAARVPSSLAPLEVVVLLVREIMYCKPGKVRPLLERFLAMAKLSEKAGMGRMRVMTDVSAERYWTVISELEVADFAAFDRMMSGADADPAAMKEMEALMKGYHEFVESGKREIYKIET